MGLFNLPPSWAVPISQWFTTPHNAILTGETPEEAYAGVKPNNDPGLSVTPTHRVNPLFGAINNLGRNISSWAQPRETSIDDILAQLQALQDPSRYAADPALLQRQAESAAAAQYDPVIASLRSQAMAAQGRANRNSQQLGSMYQGLSNSLIQDIAPIQKQFADTQNTTKQQYADLQNSIKGEYASSQAEQEAMMKRLNIEAAAPQALAGQANDKAFLVSNAASQGENVQSQLAQQGAGAVNYTRQGSELARMEGSNRQADLMAQLADYLTQVEGQVGANQAARSAAVSSNLAGLQQQSQKYALDRAQQDFSNYAQVIGIGNTLRNAQGKSTIGAVKSPIDVGPRSMSLGLDANGAQQVQNAFLTAISSDPLVLSAVDPNSGMGLSKEALANRIVEVGRSRGLSQPQLNALQEAALEYFGRQ